MRLKYPQVGHECAYVCTDLSTTHTLWTADSGASTHMGNTDVGMCNVEEINAPLNVSNGNNVRIIKKGVLPLTVLQKNGQTMDIVLRDYKHAPGLSVNLFSLTKAIQAGWKLSNSGSEIRLSKGTDMLRFDQIRKTPDGLTCGVEMLNKVSSPESAHANVEQNSESREGTDTQVNSDSGSDKNETGSDKKKKQAAHWDINTFHKIFGHASEEAMRKTAEKHGWKPTGTLESCEDCQMSNIQQKKVPKKTESKSTTPGERVFVDMSSVTGHTSLGGARSGYVSLMTRQDTLGTAHSRGRRTLPIDG